jgi:hypothetical protein
MRGPSCRDREPGLFELAVEPIDLTRREALQSQVTEGGSDPVADPGSVLPSAEWSHGPLGRVKPRGEKLANCLLGRLRVGAITETLQSIGQERFGLAAGGEA